MEQPEKKAVSTKRNNEQMLHLLAEYEKSRGLTIKEFCRQHVDMKKSFDGLCGIVRNEPGRTVNDKEIFIFLNKRCTHIKLLLAEQTAIHCFTADYIKDVLMYLLQMIKGLYN